MRGKNIEKQTLRGEAGRTPWKINRMTFKIVFPKPD